MKKVFLTLACLVLLTTVLSGCFANDKAKESEKVKAKVYFAINMWFKSNVGSRSSMSEHYRTGGYHDCVFVHSESDYESSANVIVAWPTETTEKVLCTINYFVESRGVDPEKYSLTLPITIKDVVDQWEDVNNLLNNEFDIHDIDWMLNPEKVYGWAEYSRTANEELIRESLKLGDTITEQIVDAISESRIGKIAEFSIAAETKERFYVVVANGDEKSFLLTISKEHGLETIYQNKPDGLLIWKKAD